MIRQRRLIAAVGATAAMASMTMFAAAPAGAAASPAGYVPLAGSVAAFTGHAQATGTVSGSAKLTLEVWLRPQTAAAQKFAAAVSTPGSALFHHYLSPAQYTARFGASQRSAHAVSAWLRSKGFTAVAADPTRSYVRGTGSAAKIDAAFRTELRTYRASAAVNAGRYPLRANSRAVSVPKSLAGDVLGVTGLDNAAPKLPLDRQNAKAIGKAAPPAGPASAPTAPCSHYYGEHREGGLPRQFTRTSFPTEVCGYNARQLRAAYGASSAATGRFQTVALVELGLTPDMFLTLKDYAAFNQMPAPSTTRYSELSLGQGSACGDPFDVEEQLDVESAYDMAPGAHELVIGGDSCNNGYYGLQGLFNADLAVLGTGGHPLASVASNSWEGLDETQPAAITRIEHSYLLRAAAEGVGMYFSSGDGSGVETPSSDPYATAVGGTTLGIGGGRRRLFETGWSTGISILQKGKWVFEGEQGAAGGGPSLLWRQPWYQRGVVPAALSRAPGNRGGKVRSVPDISADADPFTGIAVGVLTFPANKPPVYGEFDVGGTSLASPLVGGMVTAAEQDQHTSFGFLNPAIYRLAGTAAVHDTLPLTIHSPKSWRGVACPQAVCGIQALTTFDDQNPKMAGYTGQVTLRGYDNMSGVGTPAGARFIGALRRLEG
ncbi:MAG: protease pro-enzyme activation domain-containing protein [Streptosporangiaceae bacterium]